MEACERRVVLPFSAIVGQENAKLALLCVAVDPLIGGVLLRGDKGTGKSTLVRALANVLPEIEVVADCPFNCNPRNPLEMCDSCYQRHMRGEELPVARRKMRVVDLPLSITVDRLVGTIDVERFLKEGRRALQHGVLAEANRGILYIDEVNLLDDYIADALLDAAAMGWNIIERETVSFKHPARFILVGSMNPEEGELRPQILDRFGLCVEVTAPSTPEERAEIVRRVESFHKDPASFYEKYRASEEAIAEKVTRARNLLPKVEVSDELIKLLAETVISLGIKTSRAEITTVKTAKAIAALDGRAKVTLSDLEKAMELALPHRLKEKPLQQPPRAQLPKPKPPAGREDLRHREDSSHQHSHHSHSSLGGRDRLYQAADASAQVPGKVSLDSYLASTRSSRDAVAAVVGYPRGIPVYYTVPKGSVEDVDLYATALWAILSGKKPPVKPSPEDLRVRVRKARPPTLWVLMLDSSGSMSIQKRISVAKGIAKKLVEKGYIKRSKISLIVFRGAQATLAAPPTRNYLSILKAIDETPTGGKTPLSSALQMLLNLARRERMKEKTLAVRAFLITDGKANVPLYSRVADEIPQLSKAVKKSKISLSVYDTRGPGISPGASYIQDIVEHAEAKLIEI